jgi:basic membrane protein A
VKRLNRKPRYAFLFSLFVLCILAGCGGAQTGGGSPTNNGSPTTGADGAASTSSADVLFIYPDKTDEYNWSHLQELGRQYLLEQLPDTKTSIVEEVAPDEVEQVLRDAATGGAKLIFAASPEYSDAVLKVAPDFPNTKFEVARGTQTADNIATYDGRMYQAFYVAGGYTGELTVSGIIGVVAPEPTVEVIRNINALALTSLLIRTGEDISVHVKWTNSWNDPEAARAAALELIEEGADVLVQHTYDPEVQKVAEEKGITSFGYGFDMREFAPTENATSIVYSWGWYFVRRVNALNDGSWAGEAYYGETSLSNFGKGIIDLAPYTYDQIPQIIEAPPMKWRARFVETNKDVFDGPLVAQNGEQVLARGEKFDDDYLNTQMNWFVEGVVGDAPGVLPTPEASS